MKSLRKVSLALLVAATVLVSVTVWTLRGEASSPQRWEYRIVNVGNHKPSDPTPEQSLNLLGAEGWEVVQANINESGYGLYILKRAR
jgi:outer membrane lipopolysaccharide assembly protein LptE/RlpB